MFWITIILAELIILGLIFFFVLRLFKSKKSVVIHTPMPIPKRKERPNNSLGFYSPKDKPIHSNKSRELIPYGLSDEELELHRMFNDED